MGTKKEDVNGEMAEQIIFSQDIDRFVEDLLVRSRYFDS